MTAFMSDARRELCDLLQAAPDSPQELADRLGVDKSTLWRVINDPHYTPTPQMIEQLLDGLGYEIEITVKPRR